MRLKHIVEIIKSIFILILVALLLYINIAYHVFGYITLAVVKGKSMLPFLHENDVVIIIPSKDVALGNLVVFKNDRNEYVIHRVIAIAECIDGNLVYITKGDNNVFVDSIIWGIALKNSIECPVKNVTVLQGFEHYVRQALQGNNIKGLPSDRVVGKALTLFDMVVKITGLPSLKP